MCQRKHQENIVISVLYLKVPMIPYNTTQHISLRLKCIFTWSLYFYFKIINIPLAMLWYAISILNFIVNDSHLFQSILCSSWLYRFTCALQTHIHYSVIRLNVLIDVYTNIIIILSLMGSFLISNTTHNINIIHVFSLISW